MYFFCYTAAAINNVIQLYFWYSEFRQWSNLSLGRKRTYVFSRNSTVLSIALKTYLPYKICFFALILYASSERWNCRYLSSMMSKSQKWNDWTYVLPSLTDRMTKICMIFDDVDFFHHANMVWKCSNWFKTFLVCSDGFVFFTLLFHAIHLIP